MDQASTLVETNAQSADDAQLMDYPDSTEEIPILDIAPALSGNPEG